MLDSLARLDRLDRQLTRWAPSPTRAEQGRTDARPWREVARPEQLAPGTIGAASQRSDWRTWLVLAGRGWGKTRTGVEWVAERVRLGAKHVIIAGPTASDVRDVLVEGQSGLLSCYPEDEQPHYEPSKNRITWARGRHSPEGARAILLSAEEPNRFRGKQGDTVLCDELAAWQYPDAWQQLQFAMRLGTPRFAVTTTPKPTKLIRSLLADARVAVTRGSTFDNAANLAPDFLQSMREQFEGTRLGRQELNAELLEDVEGALWTGALIERARVRVAPADLLRTVVAIDPAVSNEENSDETGIVVAAVAECGCKSNGHAVTERHAFVLSDLSGKHSPDRWARLAAQAYADHSADRIVAEVNNGGALVEANLRTVDRNAAYTAVHAAKGKRTRAEPIAALYEQGKVHHVGGFAKLEDQMTSWDQLAGGASPDRVDALVWALTELMIIEPETTTADYMQRVDWANLVLE